MTKPEVDTTNHYVVGVRGDGSSLVSMRLGYTFTREQALNLAAYLVVLSGVDRTEFTALLDAIEAC